jgi:hypothetical protein
VGALLLCAVPVRAGDSGSRYEQDYDYPDQGDDWYGRRARPRPKRDFAPTFLDQILSGEDFCLGYDKFFDRLHLGAPLFRTNQRPFDFLFRFSAADPNYPCIQGGANSGGTNCDDGNPCTSDAFDPVLQRCEHTAVANGASCADSLFCNGAETCQTGFCVSGAPPCDDGNTCTADSCDETLNACQNVGPPLPDEVQGLMLFPMGSTSTVVLEWNVTANAADYNLYRSSTGTLSGLTCFQAGLPGPSSMDDGLVPGLAKWLLYLPAGANCTGEGSLGSGNPRAERQADMACP